MAGCERKRTQPLGVVMDVEGYESTWVQEACEVVGARALGLCMKTPKVLTRPPGQRSTSILDLNVKEVKHGRVMHLIDVVSDCTEEVDISKVSELMVANNYTSLPFPMASNSDVAMPYIMQLNIHTQEDGKVCIVKWYTFDERQSVQAVRSSLVRGKAYQPNWAGPKDVHLVRKVLQYLFENLPGTTFVYNTWADSSPRGGRELQDWTSKKEGYDFIRRCGPRANNMNQFVEWADEWINKPGSKIFGWPEGRVKESLSNYAKGAVGARTIERWPVSLKKLHGRVLDDIVIPMLRTHKTHSIFWIGKSRVGKSSVSKSIAFAVSRHHIDAQERSDLRPGVVTAKKMDFFRLEPGSIFKPAVADDICMSKLDPDEVKTFGDPGEEDALLWARWGGSSFQQNQSRQVCVNPYDKDMESKLPSASASAEEVLLRDFLKLVECNWPRTSETEDIDAYLARYHIVLLSDRWIYYRFAGNNKSNVPRMPWPTPKKPDLFTAAVSQSLKRYKQDQTYLPSDYESDIEWESALPEP